MTSSTSPRRVVRLLLVAAFWLGIWQLAHLALAQDLLLVSPVQVVLTLVSLASTPVFWSTVWYSFARIIVGFLLAVTVGCAVAALSASHDWLETLVSPAIRVMRSVPVFSFIILVLIWAQGSVLSVVISFLMVMPIVYANVLEGIRSIDPKLGQMASVFGFSWTRRLVGVVIPAVWPYLTAALEVGLGLCWKSGISGEVIGLPSGSIGERLYQAKIFLSTGDLFAWTLAIIGVSFAFERGFLALVRGAEIRLSMAFAT